MARHVYRARKLGFIDATHIDTGVDCPFCRRPYVWATEDDLLECGNGDGLCVQAEVAATASELTEGTADLNTLSRAIDACRRAGKPLPTRSQTENVSALINLAVNIGEENSK
jgi:hypothetical protein